MLLTAALCFLVLLLATCTPQRGDGGDELVANGSLALDKAEGFPPAWQPWLPEWEQARCTLRPVADGLLVEAPGRPYAVGGAEQLIEGIEGGRAYHVGALADLREIAFPSQAVTIRLQWLSGDAPCHPAGMLARGPVMDGSAARFDDVLIAPDSADRVRLTLEVRWPRGGSVLWRRVSLSATESPAPRKVKVGTVYQRPSQSTPERNMELWCEQVAAAGRLGLDIVCLSEAILHVGTGTGPGAVAKTIPGPDTERLGAVAAQHGIWVVAGLADIEGNALHNTAVLIDRQGRLAGKYRKVHLPREEWRTGVCPGDEYPVFTTDFGVIAIQICYDWFFPEVASLYALKGAEIIFAPTWGTTFPDRDGTVEGETVFRVRARDNGVYMVPSVYDGSSMVIDPLGRILTSSGGETGVFWAEVELGRREPLPWVGHWGSIGPRDRMPHTYGGLLVTDKEPGG